MKLDIPFFPNTKDNLHCTQAVLKSVLKYYFPKKDYSFNYLDKVTSHKKGKFTWDFAMLNFLSKKDFKIVDITNFDYKEFAKRGEEYLKEQWTEEIFKVQKEFSDFDAEQKFAKELLKNRSIEIINKTILLEDMKKYFREKYMLMIPINSAIIDDIDDYFPHMVLITNITDKYITYHDPGLPPQLNKRVSIEKFMKAMQYPTPESADLIAVKYNDE